MEYCFGKSLGNVSRMISRSLGKKLEIKLAANRIVVTAEQWSVISLLFQKERLSQVEISSFLGFDKVRILRLINNLEKENIIERFVSNDDKRYKIVSLTNKGIENYKRIIPFAIETHNEAFSSINKNDVDFCLSVLDKIKNNLM